MSANGKEQTFEPAKLAPFNQDSEEYTLGSPLMNPDAWPYISFLKSRDFFILRNSWVYEAMQRLADRGEPIEYLTVIEELRRMERLDEIGGTAYITYLASNVGTSLHAETYARIVQRAAIRRRMLEAAAEITRLAREEESDVQAVLAMATEALDGIVDTATVNDWIHARPAVDAYFDRVERAYKGEDDGDVITTGLTDLDARLRGFRRGRFYIIGGRPGMWKSWLMIWLALQAARQGKRVGIMSMEMTRDEILNRMVGLISGIEPGLRLNPEDIEAGQLSEGEWRRFVHCSGVLSELDIFIDDSGFQTPGSLKWKTRRLKARHDCDILFVDYLQLAHGDDDRQSEYERVTNFSKALAALSKPDGLYIPVVAVAQLNRDVESRPDKRPMTSDLRSSGQIEQDASVIMFVYRDIVYNEAAEKPAEFEVIITKNRQYGGTSKKRKGTGTVVLYHDLDNPLFANLKKTDINLEDF